MIVSTDSDEVTLRPMSPEQLHIVIGAFKIFCFLINFLLLSSQSVYLLFAFCRLFRAATNGSL
jgi:hypothetical protein